MLIGHFSDCHGTLPTNDTGVLPDVWVCTGDFFPSFGCSPKTEATKQRENYLPLLPLFLEFLGGAPILTVQGNHDFANLASLLQEVGYPVHELSLEPYEFGKVWVGYPHIPWIYGEYNYEARLPVMQELIAQALATKPDILVTHTPPAGILAGRYGCTALANALCYADHSVKLHLFGHVHEAGGLTQEVDGIHFSNGARTINWIETGKIWP